MPIYFQSIYYTICWDKTSRGEGREARSLLAGKCSRRSRKYLRNPIAKYISGHYNIGIYQGTGRHVFMDTLRKGDLTWIDLAALMEEQILREMELCRAFED